MTYLVDFIGLLGDGALVWFAASHVERHAVGENPDLLVAQRLIADCALRLVPDHHVGRLQLSLLYLRIAYL